MGADNETTTVTFLMSVTVNVAEWMEVWDVPHKKVREDVALCVQHDMAPPRCIASGEVTGSVSYTPIGSPADVVRLLGLMHRPLTEVLASPKDSAAVLALLAAKEIER